MKARDTLASRFERVAFGSPRVWAFLASLGAIVTVTSSALAEPTTAAAAASGEKAAAKAEAPKTEAPQAETKKSAADAAKAPAADTLPGDLDEPAQASSGAAAPPSGWLDGNGGRAAQPKAAEAATNPSEAAIPADGAEAKPAAEQPSSEHEPSKPRGLIKRDAQVRYALPEPTEVPTELPSVDYEREPLGRHQEHWFVGGGLRSSWITDAGFDPFSKDDNLQQFSLSAGRTAYAQDRLSFAVSGMFDIGSASATARGMSSEYQSLRLGLGLEARYHVRSWFYGYARVTPGALRTHTTLDSTGGLSYEAESWNAAVDGALGAAVRIIGSRDGRKSTPRVWLFAEGGYGWVAGQDLSLEISGSNAPPRAESIELGSLDASGAFFRIGALVSF